MEVDHNWYSRKNSGLTLGCAAWGKISLFFPTALLIRSQSYGWYSGKLFVKLFIWIRGTSSTHTHETSNNKQYNNITTHTNKKGQFPEHDDWTNSLLGRFHQIKSFAASGIQIHDSRLLFSCQHIRMVAVLFTLEESSFKKCSFIFFWTISIRDDPFLLFWRKETVSFRMNVLLMQLQQLNSCISQFQQVI